ncbi:DNA ligase LigA-related protein [Marinobacter similis]|uniref:NAD-dependent DNA ligase adenylation domain-containing protein n=1 Tax=Marinobacter similis TaxID=1420916 RepID=W5YLD8_9GAMM|nr:hypothetical protein [Marinobacter similis]AHI29719.1 hypothetical protein AU14_17655 [Marinobacter similis]
MPNDAGSPVELIRRRRAQMLIHSYLYYWMGVTIVSDHQWQDWANELRDLQQQHPAPVGFYDEEFKDWTGDTGMHLPRDPWVMSKAQYIQRLFEMRN